MRRRQSGRRAILPCDNDKAAGGPFNTATTGFRRRNYSFLRQRKLESDASPLRQILLQAGYSSLRQRKFESDTASLRLRLLQAGHSTCRHDSTALILDFKPRLGNRCSQKVKTRAIRASILDFKPRLANRCIRVAHSWGQPHPPQADSDAETVQTPQADSAAGTLSTRHKKKSPDSSLNRDSQSAAATYSPTWCSSTIGASELNFSVRDGKRWILTAITAAI